MGGIRAVQAFRREPRNEEIFEAVNRNYRNANVAAWRLIAIFAPSIKLIGNVTIAIVLTYGGYRVLHGETQVGVLAAFLLYLRKFFDPMQDLSQFYNSLQSATAALEKLSGVLDEPPGVPEPARPTPLPEPRGALDFADVSFAYRSGRPVLPEFDLHIPAGQTLAVVGPTRRYSSSTRPPRRWTSRPSASCSGRCGRSWPTAPRSSSRTDCPQWRSPTGYSYSTPAGSSRTAPRRSSSPAAAGTPRCTSSG